MTAMLLLYSCQKRTTQEMKIIKIIIPNVDQEGLGVEMEIIAISPKRILKGLGITTKRSCHQACGFLDVKIFFPASLCLSCTSCNSSPVVLVLKSDIVFIGSAASTRRSASLVAVLVCRNSVQSLNFVILTDYVSTFWRQHYMMMIVISIGRIL